MKKGPTQPGFFSRSPGDRSDVDRVKDATDIVRLIGEHVSLKPKGREYIGLCPFHDDHSPSLTVVPHKQFYKCFSCGAAGDALTFVQKFLRMEFAEALEFLADRAGITLERRVPSRHAREDTGESNRVVSKNDLLSINSLAASFYRAMLQHGEHGQAGRAVLERRGVSAQMIEEFQLGVSPDRWDGLILTAKKQGLSEEALTRAGLAKVRDSGGCYDTFRHRVMFPIHDRSGRVIAFGARAIRDEDEPKYLNSPESPLFNKSATLYALHLALREVQKTRTAIVCEGYMDAIACHQAGFRNCVATLGTALTRQHARELRLACDRVLLLFDSDEAGQRAADRAAEVFFSQPIDVGVVTLRAHTDAKDPDELLRREGGSEVFRRALEGAVDLLAFRFARIDERVRGAGLSARARAVNEEIERLVELGLGEVEPVRKAMVIRSLAQIARVSEDDVRRAVPSGRSGRPQMLSAEFHADAQRREDHALASRTLLSGVLSTGEHLLGCVLCDGSLWSRLTGDDKDALAPDGYRFDVVRRVARCVHDLGEDGLEPCLNAVLSRLAGENSAGEAGVQLMSRVHEITQGDRDRLHAHFEECQRTLRRDRASSIDVKAVEAGDPTQAAAARIARRREVLESLGPDRRRVPRPRT